LSNNNTLRRLLRKNKQYLSNAGINEDFNLLINSESEQSEDDYSENEDDDINEEETHLSINFDVLAMNSSSLIKLSIKPIEQQLQNFISQQEDLIRQPDAVCNLLNNFHLIDKRLQNRPSFVGIFDYLFDRSHIYPILKAIHKLNAYGILNI
jgi:hypothetical protein